MQPASQTLTTAGYGYLRVNCRLQTQAIGDADFLLRCLSNLATFSVYNRLKFEYFLTNDTF